MKSKLNTLVGRREFIQVSSAVAAGAVLLGPEILASEVAPPKRLAVGFVNYLLETCKLNALEVVSANKIFNTDAGFIGRGARVSVVSTGSATADPKTRRAVELNANFTYFDGADRRTAPFHAWTYDRGTGDAGNNISFLVPLDDQQQLRLNLGTEISRPASPGRHRAAGPGPAPSRSLLPFTLSLQEQPDAYRLVRGYFVLVPLAAGQSEPDWSSYRLWYRGGRWQLHEGSDLVPAAIEHLVLRVNYATST